MLLQVAFAGQNFALPHRFQLY